jgi:Tfp pilus assembly protein PilW
MLTRGRLTPVAEHGFTLMETLVAMVAGMLVISVLLTILEFSLSQNRRLNDRVLADQTGRAAMTRMMDELHSSCTGYGIAGISGPKETPTSPLAATGPANLWFVSAYGSATAGASQIEKVNMHDLNWTKTSTSKSGQQLGTLTDYVFASQSGNSTSGWTFAAPTAANATAKVLATNVIAPQVSGASTLFEYYRYESNSSSSNFGKLVSVASGELPASQSSGSSAQKAAEQIAKVEISFTQAAEAADTRSDTTANLSDSVLLRFEPSEAGAESTNSTCS